MKLLLSLRASDKFVIMNVEPNNAKIRASSYNQNNSVLISAIGTLTTIIAVFLVRN